MNVETILLLVAVFLTLNFLLFKYGRAILEKSCFRKVLLVFYLASILTAGIICYRFGLFGHLEYIDGVFYKPERPASVQKPIPPKFETEPSQVFENAKKEHRDNIDNFQKP